MSFRTFQLAKEANPVGLVPVPHPQPHICPVEADALKGEWYRAHPRTPKEIAFIQSLDLHIDKFSPAKGDGVLISSAAVKWLRERTLTRI